MKVCWLDVRNLPDGVREAVIEEAIHQRIDAIVASNAEHLTAIPPTVRRVLWPRDGRLPEELGGVDVVLVDATTGVPATYGSRTDVQYGQFVEVTDATSLERANTAARTQPWSVIRFRDPTKIPLEIVLAAAYKADGVIITEVADLEEAEIVFGVLEHGSDGVLLAPKGVGEATKLRAVATGGIGELALVELEVTGTEHIGMGERACVDTCSHFREDEGILVGSHSKGMILCCSETHPLPYMPTRPFRVNAGAIHSYTMSAEGRTHYLSELKAGSKVQAVDAKGQTRLVTVGRVKMETRPLLSIDAVSPDGRHVNIIVQDDWHVRVLGPGGVVLNTTELRPGDKVLGYLPTEDRHVGYPIDEFCIES
ncbi:3-amino-4-hydroxybenzoic acid synthase [Allocatelliglobosispora scoriae]|uniref:3-amino-4-hydroxybenzoic acid synthase n=1 Tax=Allocatelliglobosispora scoriae TaxID=643052 RepID=A0A841C3J9_9ACTN|nr:3-dehydroquinate synthase II [Allocatelliglobosispora scoriae]MBB5873632.1 3-amino-4-hydroxybenzoic acid synthase [Allocatelliglobosispora scoriae]